METVAHQQKRVAQTKVSWVLWCMPLLLLNIGFGLLAMENKAKADPTTATDYLENPTDGTSPHPFLKNPAVYQIDSNLVGSAAFLRNSGSIEAKETEDDGETETVETEISEDLWTAALHSDIGAGTAVGLVYERLFRTLEHSTSDDPDANPLEQLTTQYVGLQLIVDLTDDLVMGLMVRNLHEEVMVIGNFGLGQESATRYKTTLFGYGLGGIYRFDGGSVGGVTLPSLRGKTDVFGEEKIVSTAGETSFSADYSFAPKHRLGLTYSMVSHKRDDLAEGTTLNNDNNTPISLDGLTYDRFRFPVRRIGLGYDHTFNPKVMAIFSLFRDESEFIFDADSEPGDSDEALSAVGYQLKLNLRYSTADFVFHCGLNLTESSAEFDRSDSTKVSFESSARTLHAVLEKSL